MHHNSKKRRSTNKSRFVHARIIAIHIQQIASFHRETFRFDDGKKWRALKHFLSTFAGRKFFTHNAKDFLHSLLWLCWWLSNGAGTFWRFGAQQSRLQLKPVIATSICLHLPINYALHFHLAKCMLEKLLLLLSFCWSWSPGLGLWRN